MKNFTRVVLMVAVFPTICLGAVMTYLIAAYKTGVDEARILSRWLEIK